MDDDRRMRAAVVTVSDGVARGVRRDTAGESVVTMLQERGFTVVRRHVVPDVRQQIAALLRVLADEDVPLVVTTGGTGLGPRDVTPEATRAVIEREIPGLAEQMRAAGRGSTPFAALSRQVAGAVRATVVVNLPGSESGARESLEAILPALPHALRLVAGDTAHGPAEGAPAVAAHSHGSPETDPVEESGPRHGRRHDGAAADGRQAGEPAGGDADDRVRSPVLIRSRTVEDELSARRAAGEEVVLATAVRTEGNPPCRVGQKVLLSRGAVLAGTLGCAEFDDAAGIDTAGVLDRRTATTATYHHDLGSIEVYLEPFLKRPRLYVLGATPVARSLVLWAGDLGFDPVLVEPRLERVTDADRATGVLAVSLEDVEAGPGDAAVHTDHDAPFTVEALAGLLRSPVAFIGMMGSARHAGPHLDRLRGLGFSDTDLARIRTPVGLDIGARTPQEIALSILAGLVTARNEAAGGWLDRRPPPGPHGSATRVAR